MNANIDTVPLRVAADMCNLTQQELLDIINTGMFVAPSHYACEKPWYRKKDVENWALKNMTLHRVRVETDND